MSLKSVFTKVLLAFVLVSIVFLFVNEIRHGSAPGSHQSSRTPLPQRGFSADSIPSASKMQDKGHQVIVYYFHGTARCPSCLKIEAYTKEVVLDTLADAIEDGRLEWRVVNTDEPGNGHFVTDYRLYTKSVVVVDAFDGRELRWKNLRRVWELLHDKQAFINYIREEVDAYLGGA